MQLPFLAYLLISFFGFAAAPTSKKDFCAKHADLTNFQDLILKQENRLSFMNPPGYDGGGVCWWHNRFERNATYLNVYLPREPRPSHEQALLLIDAIIFGQAIVYVPGYKNLREFSVAYEKEITEALSRWKSRDNLSLNWLAGLVAPLNPSPKILQKSLDATYAKVQGEKKITYWVLQTKGIMEAHSFLVAKMEKSAGGYWVKGVDSNVVGKTFPALYYPHMQVPDFRETNSEAFVKYLERNGFHSPYLQMNMDAEATRLIQIGTNFCKN